MIIDILLRRMKYLIKREEFKLATEKSEGGEELLIRKSTGYISYVRGENPFHFHIEFGPRCLVTLCLYFLKKTMVFLDIRKNN